MIEQGAGEFIRVQSALAGRYSLQRELGRGGMGIVYLAHDVALDRPVALKLLQSHLASQPEVKQRFLNEARTAARLSHPHIVPIFAVDDIGDIVFFVMAYVDGETLGQRVRNRGPLPVSEVGKILREVGWGLGYAHAQGVVHRDVKADNIMVERATGRALIVDFGIARVAQASGLTGADDVLGTAEYMSPEQASGEAADHRSDIYSLGVVAYFAISGRLPFEGKSAGAVLAKHITQPAPRLADHVQGLPASLANAVDRCLAKDPAHRFDSAEALSEALADAIAQRREAPFPVRHFIKGASDAGQNLIWLTYFQLSCAATGAMFALTPAQVGVEVFVGLALTFLAAEPVLGVGMLGHIRALLKSGYTREDLTAVWERELQLAREERALEHGSTAGRLERASRWVFAAGWGSVITLAAVAPPWPVADVLGPVSWMVGNLGGLMALWRYDGRTALSRRLTGWFLKSRVGRWAFKLAGVGLDRSKLASQAADRPTELAIGMAVDSLFDALPEATRRQFAELPSVVRKLEADAMRMRERVGQLNEASARVGPGSPYTPHPSEPGPVVGRRDVLVHDLGAARDAAKKRLADAVTALETIRLELLRLTAGAGSADNLTADLTDARALSQEVARLLQARAEIEAFNSHSRT